MSNKKRFLKAETAQSKNASYNQNTIDNIKSFFQMILDTIKGRYQPNFRNLVFSILILLYVISPIDIIPEIVLGPIGLIDDLAIFMFGLKYMMKEIRRYYDWKQGRLGCDNIEDAKIIE